LLPESEITMMFPRRRFGLVALIVAAITCASREASARPLYLWVEMPTSYGNLYLDNTLGTIATNESYASVSENSGWPNLHVGRESLSPCYFVAVCPHREYELEASMYMETGPLTQFTPFDSYWGGSSVYRYAAGGTVVGDWWGQPMSMTLGPVTVYADDMGGYFDYIEVTSARFDPVTAAYLGFNPNYRVTGTFELWLDFNEHDEGQQFRVGRSFGYLGLAVPEPALMTLLPLGLGLLFARRRTVRKVTATQPLTQ
jgi:hypothetical protein